MNGRSMRRYLRWTPAVVLGLAAHLHAAPIAVTEGDGIKLTLTDEPCKLEAVKNLRGRAEWVEKDRTYQGCWGSALSGQIVVVYFDDLTVAALPAQIFKRVSGI